MDGHLVTLEAEVADGEPTGRFHGICSCGLSVVGGRTEDVQAAMDAMSHNLLPEV